jgi:hypothetical protein
MLLSQPSVIDHLHHPLSQTSHRLKPATVSNQPPSQTSHRLKPATVSNQPPSQTIHHFHHLHHLHHPPSQVQDAPITIILAPEVGTSPLSPESFPISDPWQAVPTDDALIDEALTGNLLLGIVSP